MILKILLVIGLLVLSVIVFLVFCTLLAVLFMPKEYIDSMDCDSDFDERSEK